VWDFVEEGLMNKDKVQRFCWCGILCRMIVNFICSNSREYFYFAVNTQIVLIWLSLGKS
jgi:hypothetical protein